MAPDATLGRKTGMAWVDNRRSRRFRVAMFGRTPDYQVLV